MLLNVLTATVNVTSWDIIDYINLPIYFMLLLTLSNDYKTLRYLLGHIITTTCKGMYRLQQPK